MTQMQTQTLRVNKALNFVPSDTILDTDSSMSMIDIDLWGKLGLSVNRFSCDISHCLRVEHSSML